MRKRKLTPGGRLTAWQVRQFLHRVREKRVLLPHLSVQCLSCGRPLDTILERLWHRMVCWKRHPKQAGLKKWE